MSHRSAIVTQDTSHNTWFVYCISERLSRYSVTCPPLLAQTGTPLFNNMLLKRQAGQTCVAAEMYICERWHKRLNLFQ